MSSDALTFHMPGFEPNHDFFSTDVPMPSSPPRLFDLYEDPLTMGMHEMDNMDNAMWSDFPMDDGVMQGLGTGLTIDANGHESFDMGTKGQDDVPNIKVEVVDASNKDLPDDTKLERRAQKN
jgi:hypothetical protein